MESTLQDHPAVRRLAGGWLLLALCALALSTLCALLLIAARTPLLAPLAAGGELFRRTLVLHVGLAVLVWFGACAAGFWTMAAGAAGSSARWCALALGATGLAAMVAPLLLGVGQPLLANYIPVLDHPLFLAGLALFLAGVALCGACSLLPLLRRVRAGPPWRLGALLSLAAFALALLALLASAAQSGPAQGQAGFELLAWGPGHILQFVHVSIMLCAWHALAEQVFGAPPLAPRTFRAVLLLAFLPLLAAPLLYLQYPLASAGFRRGFTLLMAFGAWPAAALMGLAVLRRLWQGGRAAWAAPLAPALLLSVLLFLLGCVIGSLIRADSTMVPAHYHGTVGAVTLAYMALGYRLLAAWGGAATARLSRLQPQVYGSGLLLLALALAWSGALGVPRKTLHVDVIVQYPAYFAAMGLAGLGGLLAIGGALLFLAAVARSLRRAGTTAPARRDVRLRALALTVAATVAFGLLLANLPADQGEVVAGAAPDPGHAARARAAEVARRFAAGTALLNARQFQPAASELHRVLELAPKLPEAHVNMGYAMIGLQRHTLARDFFDSAILLNVNQRNAYFGLAVALEGIGDLEGALGAMRSYVHLAGEQDPYLRKANAAIWEWRAELDRKRASQ
jgi:cytochrome c oxidase subunit 1